MKNSGLDNCHYNSPQLTSVAVIVIMFSWESQGLRVYDLDDSVIGINYRNYVYAYFGLAAFTIAYAVSMILLGCGGCAIPSIFVSFNQFIGRGGGAK